MSCSIEPKRRLVLPTMDFYQEGSMKLLLQNWHFSRQIFEKFFAKIKERQDKIHERVEKLQSRGKELGEQIGSIINSEKGEKILTPAKFPSNYAFDFEKTAKELLKMDVDIIGDSFDEIFAKSLQESFSLHSRQDRGHEPKVSKNDFNQLIAMLFRNSQIPNIFARNNITKSGHLDGLHDKRSDNSKRRLKCIDNITCFNTKDNIFGESVPQVAMRKRGVRRLRNQQKKVDNPIGLDLANTRQLDNTMANSLIPNINADGIEFKPEKREAAKIEIEGGLGLSGVVDFGFDGDSDFMSSNMGFGFDMDDTGFTGFDEDPLAKKPKVSEPVPQQTTQTGPAQPPISATPNLPNVNPSTPNQPGESVNISGASNIPSAPALNIPPPPPFVPGAIPPPPPISILNQPIVKETKEQEVDPDARPPPPKTEISDERMNFLDEIRKGDFKLKKTVTRESEVPPSQTEALSNEDYLRQQVALRHEHFHKKPIMMRRKKQKKRRGSSEEEGGSDDDSSSASKKSGSSSDSD